MARRKKSQRELPNVACTVQVFQYEKPDQLGFDYERIVRKFRRWGFEPMTHPGIPPSRVARLFIMLFPKPNGNDHQVRVVTHRSLQYVPPPPSPPDPFHGEESAS